MKFNEGVKFHFGEKSPKIVDSHVPLPAIEFPSPITSNRGSNKGKISFRPINSQKHQFPCGFCPSNTYDFQVLIKPSIFLLPVASISNKVQISFCPIN